MSAFFDDPDAALAHVRSGIAAAQERAAKGVEARARMDAIRGTARSRRGEVTAVVDPSGRLRDLTFSEDATELRASDLAQVVLQTVQAAGGEAGRQAVAVMGEAFGPDSSVTTRLREELAARQS